MDGSKTLTTRVYDPEYHDDIINSGRFEVRIDGKYYGVAEIKNVSFGGFIKNYNEVRYWLGLKDGNNLIPVSIQEMLDYIRKEVVGGIHDYYKFLNIIYGNRIITDDIVMIEFEIVDSEEKKDKSTFGLVMSFG